MDTLPFKICRRDIPPKSGYHLWSVEMNVDAHRFVRDLFMCPSPSCLVPIRPMDADHKLAIEAERRILCAEIRLMLWDKYANDPNVIGYDSIPNQPFGFDDVAFISLAPIGTAHCTDPHLSHEWEFKRPRL
ncbi:MAG TPA: hypothetical protein VMT96_00055 [Candidatus Bathyarchaeia archaeon]|nr:hypothetical protein [Candidatus Bathyarchaeia archaeon]